MRRRDFLGASAATLALSGYPIHGFTKDAPRGRIIAVILEGGLDGLTAVPPVGDDSLERTRRPLLASHPLMLNPFFAIHPNLRNFADLLMRNEAAIVHATAFPYTGRSHFEGQDIIQTGNMTPFASQSGWLGRAMEIAGVAGRAFSLDTPTIIRGTKSIENFYPASLMGSEDADQETLAALVDAHDGEAKEVLIELQSISKLPPRPIIRDPVSLAIEAGKAMQDDAGPRVAVIRIPEFDTHANQGADAGRHPALLSILDKVFAGLKHGLGARWSDAVALTLTEFGRTVSVNGSAGTDHGYGSVGLLAGGLLGKANVIANWPGLSNRDLYQDRDLYATIDYRSVCAAVIEAALQIDHDVIADRVFNEPKLKRIYNVLFSA